MLYLWIQIFLFFLCFVCFKGNWFKMGNMANMGKKFCNRASCDNNFMNIVASSDRAFSDGSESDVWLSGS